MTEHEARLFLIFIIMTIVVGYYIITRFHVDNLKRFQLTVSFLGGISALLIAYEIYLDIKTNTVIEHNRVVYDTIANVSHNFLEPQKELLKEYPEGFFLYASMQQDMDLGDQVPKQFDPIKRAQLELYTAYRIFQTVEDFLTTARYDVGKIRSWVNVFLKWLQSPVLQSHWKKIMSDYDPDTRKFVEQLIEKAKDLVALRKKKGSLRINDYDDISSKISVVYR